MPSLLPIDGRATRAIVLEPPHYLVGPDAVGHWLAVETHGSGGGIFVTRDAALRYARGETGRREGAVDLVERLLGSAFAVQAEAA